MQKLSPGIEASLHSRSMDLLTQRPTKGNYDAERRRKWAGVRFLYNIINQKPYRYHSLSCALEVIPGKAYTVSRAAFVSRLMTAYRFNHVLKMDRKLSSIYECFEGAEDNAIDYRDILCCIALLRQHRKIREDPYTLFRNLVLLYSDESDTKVFRRYALRVARMGALYQDEILQTSTRLDNWLVEKAGSWGLKQNFTRLEIMFLMEVIESNPSLLVTFATQLWRHVPQPWKVKLSRATEEKLSSCVLAIKLEQSARLYATKLLHWIIVGWKTFTNQSKAIRAQRMAIERVKWRLAIRGWHRNLLREETHRKNRIDSSNRQRLVILRRYFKRIVRLVETRKKFAAINWAHSKQGKLVLFGAGLLRGILRKRSMRLTLKRWCETSSLMMAWELAGNHFRVGLMKRMFILLKDALRSLITARRLDEEAATRAARIAEAIEEAAREKNMLADAAEAAAKRRKAQAKANLMRERAAEHRARIEDARDKSRARDEEIFLRQREARRRRVYEERGRMTRDFEDEWDTKSIEIVEKDMEAARIWLRTGTDAPFRVKKELEILKRKFFAAPTPETVELERALEDPANFIFAHMANILFKENKSLHAFFQQFDREGDGYLAHEEFQGMVSSLDIKLSEGHIRAVIRSIDLDGGGYIDFKEFEAAVKRHEDVCGVAGSPWKMYVSPVHAIMILHNIETNEEIWDYKATDKALERVVRENIVELEGIAAKNKASEERKEAWENMIRTRAAITLQRTYHIWAARKKRAISRWKLDLQKAKIKHRSDSIACTEIQCWWRRLRAKWLAQRLLQITVEVLFDPGSNRPYYFNHGLGTALWELPRILRRWYGQDAKMPELPEWVFILRTSGESYFYSTRNYSMREDVPPGYRRCHSCNTHLATRRCKTERRDLCFVCYRREHLEGDGCWHDWESTETQTTCGVCGQLGGDDSTTFSSTGEHSRGLPCCNACWGRTHAQPDTGGGGNLSIPDQDIYDLGNDEEGHPDHYYGAELFGHVLIP